MANSDQSQNASKIEKTEESHKLVTKVPSDAEVFE